MVSERVICDLEQQIRWIEEIECHQFPGWLNVTNAMREAITMLKEQDETIDKLLFQIGKQAAMLSDE